MSAPHLLRGSLITLRRKCGRPSCHCAKDAPHETPALSYSVRRKTGILTLPEDLVPSVKAALRRYRQAADDLETQAVAGIRQLKDQLQAARSRRVRR